MLSLAGAAVAPLSVFAHILGLSGERMEAGMAVAEQRQDPFQRARLVLADSSRASMTLWYSTGQSGWFFDLEYGDKFALSGVRLVSSPNLLRSWRDILPFGLAVLTKNKSEPLRQTDLSDGTVELYLLEGDDISYVEKEFFARS